jgi:REP element-mobilizing transposase RayT
MNQSEMPFDPEEDHRRSIRLRSYDYSQPGAYFVTICTHQRKFLLGCEEDGKIILSDFGSLVERIWQTLPAHYPGIELEAYVIMPNHIHGIIKRRGEAFAAETSRISSISWANASPPSPFLGTKPNSLAAIIQNFKSVSTRKINQRNNSAGTQWWQRNYYEHVIRNEKSLLKVQQYIAENPLRWAFDKENPANIVL